MATYDEIQIGDSATFTKTISESDVYLFAGITGKDLLANAGAQSSPSTPAGAAVKPRSGRQGHLH
mgnify:CR=1 FL=1